MTLSTPCARCSQPRFVLFFGITPRQLLGTLFAAAVIAAAWCALRP